MQYIHNFIHDIETFISPSRFFLCTIIYLLAQFGAEGQLYKVTCKLQFENPRIRHTMNALSILILNLTF
jgi:hypothetical protein